VTTAPAEAADVTEDRWPGAGRFAGPGVVCQGGRVSYPPQASVVIVGGGIAGLAAAFFLRDRGLAVTVLEGSPRLGGKLAVSEIAGIEVD